MLNRRAFLTALAAAPVAVAVAPPAAPKFDVLIGYGQMGADYARAMEAGRSAIMNSIAYGRGYIRVQHVADGEFRTTSSELFDQRHLSRLKSMQIEAIPLTPKCPWLRRITPIRTRFDPARLPA